MYDISLPLYFKGNIAVVAYFNDILENRSSF